MIDALTSPTLKHLREKWWNDEFTGFLVETLRPRPGKRILDVGCAEGLAEVSIGRLHLSQIRLVGVDLFPSKVAVARHETASHNQRALFAAGDACRLPFKTRAFDSTFAVAVLQYVNDVDAAVSEIARVTSTNGRVVVVEPDNTARYSYSSVPAGADVFEAAARLFAAVNTARGESAGLAIGPRLPELFTRYGVDPIEVRLFPVSYAQLGAPTEALWHQRRSAIERLVQASTAPVAKAVREYVDALAVYQQQATAAGSSFVEIQNTLLFATVGQRG